MLGRSTTATENSITQTALQGRQGRLSVSLSLVGNVRSAAVFSVAAAAAGLTCSSLFIVRAGSSHEHNTQRSGQENGGNSG